MGELVHTSSSVQSTLTCWQLLLRPRGLLLLLLLQHLVAAAAKCIWSCCQVAPVDCAAPHLSCT